MLRMTRLLLVLLCICSGGRLCAQSSVNTQVLIIGGGTGGTAAGIQSARSGAQTLIVEEGPWLGGMISAAGVSAIDGNHRLPSGLWAEFRNQIYAVYGGPKAVETGWVSNTQFEPHVADSIFKVMAGAEKNLQVLYGYRFTGLQKKGERITSVQFVHRQTGKKLNVQALTYVDATELGDVFAKASCRYDVGMEAGSITGEKVGIATSNKIVQDLTWVAVLKDYGQGVDCTVTRPANYTPEEFDGSNTDYYKDKSRKAPTVNAQRMLDYGRLPHNKYMLNWPAYGNDTYINVVELSPAQRDKALEAARQTTLRFTYFIQQTLGFKNLGLANDEFPTADRLALMPYHREGRRVQGLVRYTMRHIAEPFTYGDALYRTGISVGDYPIDHHHKKNEAAPQHLEFYPIPSFNVPLGALIPKDVSNLVVAEKGISVSNVANGTTRLQPCVLLTGQAAGVLAALSVLKKQEPKKISVRKVQEELLNAKAYIMPYIDVQPDHPHFKSVQKIGATGILKGTGIPFKWANQTWFYPDSLVNGLALNKDLAQYQAGNYSFGKTLTIGEALALAQQLSALQKTEMQRNPEASWKTWGLYNFTVTRPITRLELAVLLDKTIDPFGAQGVDHRGRFTDTTKSYKTKTIQ